MELLKESGYLLQSIKEMRRHRTKKSPLFKVETPHTITSSQLTYHEYLNGKQSPTQTAEIEGAEDPKLNLFFQEILESRYLCKINL